jgi:hypothetical protein
VVAPRHLPQGRQGGAVAGGLTKRQLSTQTSSSSSHSTWGFPRKPVHTLGIVRMAVGCAGSRFWESAVHAAVSAQHGMNFLQKRGLLTHGLGILICSAHWMQN